MPIPIIIGIAAAAAAYGAAKGVSGAIDHSNAKSLNSDARSMVDAANRQVEDHRKSTNKTLEDYGQRKLRAFNGVISDFITTFERLKNVDVMDSPELDKLNAGDYSNNALNGLRTDYQALKDAGLGLGAGMGSGAALAFGAYNGTMLLATASTGTAISSLGGVAATNATLAWLGGGSLAAGGYGMAGGMMVLGGIVAGPALAIFGHILGSKGETALNNARSNLEQAKTIRDEAKLMADKLQAIEKVTALANSTFSIVSAHLRHAVHDLKIAIQTHGEDYREFPQEARETTLLSVKFAQLLKAMIDTAILDESGNLVLSTEKRIQDVAAVTNGDKQGLDAPKT
jgi:type II secretory pathway pseudopilin PulG